MKIFGCILLLLIIFLSVPITVLFETKSHFTVTLKYFWLEKKILPKKKKSERSAEGKAKDKEVKEKKKQRELTYSLLEIWELLQKLIGRLSPSVRRLLRRTTAAKFCLRIVVVGDDAADTAIKFGEVNAAVFSAVALLDRVFTLRVKQIDIIPGFGSDTSEINFSGVVKLAPLALLISGVQWAFWGLVSATPLLLSKSRNRKQSKKSDRDKTTAGNGKEESNGKEAPLK